MVESPFQNCTFIIVVYESRAIWVAVKVLALPKIVLTVDFTLLHFRVNVGEQNIRVSMNIPPGYLGYENFGMGKGVSKLLILVQHTYHSM